MWKRVRRRKGLGKLVVKYFEDNPTATSYEIAEYLNCCDAYVRKTISRNGLKLARSINK